MNAVTKIGKYLFALPLIIMGFMYLINAETMTAMVPITGGVAWIYVSGLVMLLAGVAILIGKKDAVATFLLALTFLINAFLIDLPSVVEADWSNAFATNQLLKDILIAGAAFVYCRTAAKDRTWRLV